MASNPRSGEGIENKSNVEKNEDKLDKWNPLLYVRHWFVDPAFSSFKQLPFIRIKKRGKLLFQLMNYLEFHRRGRGPTLANG